MSAPRSCATCGAELPPKEGPGRPPTYCGEACRRLAEWRIRMLARRIAGYELEQRGLKFEGPSDNEWDERERQRRMRALRKWLAADEARLRELIAAGQNNQTTDERNQS